MAPIQQYRKTSGPMSENLNKKQYHGGKVHTLHGMRKGKHCCGRHEVTRYQNVAGLAQSCEVRRSHAFQGSHAHNKLCQTTAYAARTQLRPQAHSPVKHTLHFQHRLHLMGTSMCLVLGTWVTVPRTGGLKKSSRSSVVSRISGKDLTWVVHA